MAVFNNFTKICWKNFQSDQLNKQLFYVVRSLHKSAASEALGISATEEETMPNRMIKPEEVSQKTQIKTLNDMPGPNTLSNLIEFFWKDGFGRIHEIQVMVLNLMLHFHFFSIGSKINKKMSWPRILSAQPNLSPMRKMAM